MLEELSHPDLVKLMAVATQCAEARAEWDLLPVFDSLSGLVPFQKAAVCAISMRGGFPTLEHFVNHSFGAEWAELYTSRGYVQVDPVIRYAFEVHGPFAWHEAFRAKKGPPEFLAAAMDHGLRGGVAHCCATEAAASSRTVISFALDGADRWRRAMAIALGIGPHIHELYRRLRWVHPVGRAAGDQSLSPREVEILNWAKEGKTSWEIGCILGISERTVKFHFTRIREKLDVSSRCHAVAKAMSMGLIA
jgi:LuxR family transcriptional regulator, quorum-sensing system regulator CviR